MMRRRLVIKVGLFLLFGAIVSFAVALACLRLPVHSYPAPWLYPSEADWKAIEPLGYPRKPSKSMDACTYDWRGFGVRGHEVWYRVALTQSTSPKAVLQVSPIASVESGWPFRCLHGGRSIRREVAEAWIDGQALNYEHQDSRVWMVSLDHHPHEAFLPQAPIWTGVILNTVFFGTVLWFSLSAPFALRRYLRIRAKRCPGCAYPMGVSDRCTECGALLPSVPYKRYERP